MRQKKEPTGNYVKLSDNTANDTLTTADKVMTAAYCVLLFFAMTLQTGKMSIVLAVTAIVSLIGKRPLDNLGARLNVPVAAFFAFAVMNGLAAIYSNFGGYAVSEYYKFIASFSMTVILLSRFSKKHVRGLLWGFAAVCAVISVLCTDSVTDVGIFRAFSALIGKLGGSYDTVVQDVWSERVNGIYNDANISGGLFAIGTMTGIYLTATEQKKLWKLASCVLLGASATGLILSVSRGAMIALAAGLFVWLIVQNGQRRLEIFFLMLITVCASFALAIPLNRAISEREVLPLVITPISGLVIFVLDLFIGSRPAQFLWKHKKAAAAAVAVIAAAVGIYAVFAVSVTGPYNIPEGKRVERILALPSGEYTVTGDWDEGVNLRVTSQTNTQILVDELTVLYNGSIDEASFTVPDNAGGIHLMFSTRVGAQLRKVELSDGTSVKLYYKLLPESVANRIQGGLFSGFSFLGRIQFFKDAWEIFKGGNILIGSGLGSTEGLYTAYQPFFYETLYVHNHILQVLDDMGIIGSLSFITFLAGSLWMMFRNRKKSDYFPLLIGCWVVINVHSLFEINFSVRAYQCTAFLFLLLPAIILMEPGSTLNLRKEKTVGIAVTSFAAIYLCIFGGLLGMHRSVENQFSNLTADDYDTLLVSMKSFAEKDVFDDEKYMLSYVGNAVLINDPKYQKTMKKYVEKLRSYGTYTACSGLCRYYYLKNGDFDELFECSRDAIWQEASANDAWNLQVSFYMNEVLPAVTQDKAEMFLRGVYATKEYLDTYNRGRIEEIILTEKNSMFLNAVKSAVEQGLDASEAVNVLSVIAGQE